MGGGELFVVGTPRVRHVVEHPEARAILERGAVVHIPQSQNVSHLVDQHPGPRALIPAIAPIPATAGVSYTPFPQLNAPRVCPYPFRAGSSVAIYPAVLGGITRMHERHAVIIFQIESGISVHGMQRLAECSGGTRSRAGFGRRHPYPRVHHRALHRQSIATVFAVEGSYGSRGAHLGMRTVVIEQRVQIYEVRQRAGVLLSR
mmetsp:Transcript_36175/g.108319  ORF Transcript_36175/g.108319 Transcript_36175/m.108319 type:complete len:203 (+) Transcript_36175:1206-1814(+)